MLKSQHPSLSAYDCFTFVAAKHHEGSILLTGDSGLRRVAERSQMEVHGVLWVADELEGAGGFGDASLITTLEVWMEDKTVFLPDAEIDHRLHRLRRKR